MTESKRSRINRPGWIAGNSGGGRHVAGHDGTGAHDRPFSNPHTGQQEGAGADVGVGTHADRDGLQGIEGIAKIMGARVEVDLFGHTGAVNDLQRRGATGMSAVAKNSQLQSTIIV